MGKMITVLKRNIEYPVYVIVFLVLTLLHNFGIVNSYVMQVLMLACIYIIMAESLNILNGIAVAVAVTESAVDERCCS